MLLCTQVPQQLARFLRHRMSSWNLASNGRQTLHTLARHTRARGVQQNAGAAARARRRNPGARSSARTPTREFHICRARPAVPIRIAGALCSAQGLWGPSESRVPYLPRVLCGAQRLSRPFRIASSICSTQGPRGPAEKRVDFIETLQTCK